MWSVGLTILAWTSAAMAIGSFRLDAAIIAVFDEEVTQAFGGQPGFVCPLQLLVKTGRMKPSVPPPR